MIFVITGLSGVGKSTILKAAQEELFKRTGEFISELRLVTDRPIRPSEFDGIDYFFLTKQEYSDFLSRNLFATNEIIEVYQDTWRYAVLTEFLSEDRIFAGSPEQVRQLKDFFNDEQSVISINITVSEEERIKRILSRNDNQHEEEVKRRTIEDAIKYSNFKPDYEVSNDKTISDTANDVADIIKKYIYNNYRLYSVETCLT